MTANPAMTFIIILGLVQVCNYIKQCIIASITGECHICDCCECDYDDDIVSVTLSSDEPHTCCGGCRNDDKPDTKLNTQK